MQPFPAQGALLRFPFSSFPVSHSRCFILPQSHAASDAEELLSCYLGPPAAPSKSMLPVSPNISSPLEISPKNRKAVLPLLLPLPSLSLLGMLTPPRPSAFLLWHLPRD